jgi:hypothetical protein
MSGGDASMRSVPNVDVTRAGQTPVQGDHIDALQKITSGIKLYPTSDGWIYEVWFMNRAIVIGCCATFAAATREALLV